MSESRTQSARTSGAFAAALRADGEVPAPLIDWAAAEAQRTDRDVADLLAERSPTHEEAVYRLLADFLGAAYEPLDERQPDAALVARLPSRDALAGDVAPLARDGDQVVLVTSRPETLLRSDELATRIGAPVRVALTAPSRLRRYLERCYGLGAETVSDVVTESRQAEPRVELVASPSVSITDQLDSVQEASVTRFVNRVLFEAVQAQASDIHVEPFERELHVRFRIDGVLQDVPVPPAVKQLEQAIISRIKVLADMDIAEKRLTQDGQIRLNVLGRTVDVRVSVVPSIYGESVVLRILDRQAQYRDLGELGMPGEMLADFRRVLSLAQGLVLVTGPTGSGKTTTLYASLNHVRGPERKIITIEDPVEYRLEGITQIQVRESIGLGFSNLLRNIVRHDPDVIMIGEIRDAATANIAMNAAITGHLVVATLHTNDAPTAIGRLAGMGVPRYMIASAVKVVLAQRLVRVVCEHCKQPDTLSDEALREFPALSGHAVYRGTGCEACRQSGYRGRTGIFESFLVGATIAEQIADGAPEATIRHSAAAGGLVPLRTAGVERVIAGVTSCEELYRVTRDVTENPGTEQTA
ncbi:MAG: type II/IV secretion system protein [Phycisphaerae bacterium]|nr:type II/IV secretion system protein [Phycisphaerae bacterium]